jgi:hypothetical protein
MATSISHTEDWNSNNSSSVFQSRLYVVACVRTKLNLDDDIKFIKEKVSFLGEKKIKK